MCSVSRGWPAPCFDSCIWTQIPTLFITGSLLANRGLERQAMHTNGVLKCWARKANRGLERQAMAWVMANAFVSGFH